MRNSGSAASPTHASERVCLTPRAEGGCGHEAAPFGDLTKQCARWWRGYARSCQITTRATFTSNAEMGSAPASRSFPTMPRVDRENPGKKTVVLRRKAQLQREGWCDRRARTHKGRRVDQSPHQVLVGVVQTRKNRLIPGGADEHRAGDVVPSETRQPSFFVPPSADLRTCRRSARSGPTPLLINPGRCDGTARLTPQPLSRRPIHCCLESVVER